jgi:glycosyltransferase involved in cell wall biosynthesis
MASFNRDPDILRRVLKSIYSQNIPFKYEVIIADDGSEHGAPDVCQEFPVRHCRIDREPVPRCPAVARNTAYKKANGSIIIAQSDDVVHETPNAIERLCAMLEKNPKTFVLANVVQVGGEGQRTWTLSGPVGRQRRPYFFLGALWRTDLFAVGGDDEEFTTSGGYCHEDRWFALCLQNGRQLAPLYAKGEEVKGVHQPHKTRWIHDKSIRINWKLYRSKVRMARRSGQWQSSGGPWEIE